MSLFLWRWMRAIAVGLPQVPLSSTNTMENPLELHVG